MLEVNVIVAVLAAVGFAYAVARHVRYISPEERQRQRIQAIIRSAKKRDVGPVNRGYRTLEEQRDIESSISTARRLGYEPPEWPYAATTRASLDRLRGEAEGSARRSPTDHPRDDEGRLT